MVTLVRVKYIAVHRQIGKLTCAHTLRVCNVHRMCKVKCVCHEPLCLYRLRYCHLRLCHVRVYSCCLNSVIFHLNINFKLGKCVARTPLLNSKKWLCWKTELLLSFRFQTADNWHTGLTYAITSHKVGHNLHSILHANSREKKCPPKNDFSLFNLLEALRACQLFCWNNFQKFFLILLRIKISFRVFLPFDFVFLLISSFR